MKHFLPFLIALSVTLFSCNNDENNTSRIRVNHYKQTAIGLSPQFVYLVQKDDKIGSNEWTYLYDGIEGFDYEYGYIYDIVVTIKNIDNPPADASSIEYTLEDISTKEKVSDSISFEVYLKNTNMSTDSMGFVTGNAQDGYKILNTIAINCDTLCAALVDSLKGNNYVSGIFTHRDQNAHQLVDIKTTSIISN